MDPEVHISNPIDHRQWQQHDEPQQCIVSDGSILDLRSFVFRNEKIYHSSFIWRFWRIYGLLAYLGDDFFLSHLSYLLLLTPRKFRS